MSVCVYCVSGCCVNGSKTNFPKCNKVYSIHSTHHGFGCALFTVTAEVVDVSEFLDPVLCRVQQVYVAGIYLRTHRASTEKAVSNLKKTIRITAKYETFMFKTGSRQLQFYLLLILGMLGNPKAWSLMNHMTTLHCKKPNLKKCK